MRTRASGLIWELVGGGNFNLGKLKWAARKTARGNRLQRSQAADQVCRKQIIIQLNWIRVAIEMPISCGAHANRANDSACIPARMPQQSLQRRSVQTTP